MMFFRNITIWEGGMKKEMPEIVALGVYDGELVHKNRMQTPPRRVHLYEIELILEDGGTTYVDDQAYPIRAGNVIIGKPGQMRHTVLPFKCLYLHLVAEDGELAALLEALPDVYTPADPLAIENSLRMLITAYTEPDLDGGMRVAAELCAHLSRLIRDARLTAGVLRERGNQAHIVERAIAYMDANNYQNLTLSDIADHVHLSRIYFHNLFVAATGRTPRRYLLERRIAHARQLLMTTDKSLGQIAMECGFSSQSYFNQVFARELGCSPKEYKREMSLRY